MSASSPRPELEPGVKTEFEGQLTYGRYLKLDELLSCQAPVSDSHDELLFIVIHQATELWLKLTVHELRAARAQLRADDLQPAFKMLARVSRIQAQLIQSWDVLSTLTPADYLAFRDRLGPASGFQSHQYRLLEYLLGNKQAGMLAVHRHTPEIHAELADELARPSLYDEALLLLARRGMAIDPAHLARDWRGLAQGLPGAAAALGPLRAGRGSGRPRGLAAAVALPPRHHGRADHRPQDRDRRQQRRELPEARARRVQLSGAVAGSHGALSRTGKSLQNKGADLAARPRFRRFFPLYGDAQVASFSVVAVCSGVRVGTTGTCSCCWMVLAALNSCSRSIDPIRA